MSFDSINPAAHAARRRGFTLVELLVALAVASAFLGGTYVAISRILTAHDRSEARLEALRNGRAAITTISDEFKSINRLGSDFLLIGLDQALAGGDGIDNDSDGVVDEDVVDGLLDTSRTLAAADQHAQIGSFRERPLRVGAPDLGDADVDVDVRFGRDAIVFRIFPRVPTPDLTLKTVTYSVEEFDGEANVLVKRTRIERQTGEPLVGVAPQAFEVLGFDVLYWDPNAAPEEQYWVRTWDSSQAANFNPPRLPLPAALYVRLTLNSDERPHSTIDAGEPVKTLVLESTIDVEQTINDALYPRPDL
jgi:prepilin-type N-terminal cleavage/methylation domain-containing protein